MQRPASARALPAFVFVLFVKSQTNQPVQAMPPTERASNVVVQQLLLLLLLSHLDLRRVHEVICTVGSEIIIKAPLKIRTVYVLDRVVSVSRPR